MTVEMVLVDIYTAVYSESLGRVLKSGEMDIEVPAKEAEPWLRPHDYQYALLSSEREVEDTQAEAEEDTEEPEHESGPVKETSASPSETDDEHAGTDDGDVGDGDAGVDWS